MVSGRVDATLGAYWNYEAIQLAQLGKHPNVIRVDQRRRPDLRRAGARRAPVRAGELERRAPPVRAGARARVRGRRAAIPQAAVANLVRANPGLDPKFQLASVRATLPAFFPANASEPWGWQDPTQWNAYGQWMLSHHLISNPNAVVAASTNEVLAGQGVPGPASTTVWWQQHSVAAAEKS